MPMDFSAISAGKLRQRLNLLFYVTVTLGPLLLGVGYALLYSLGLTGLVSRGLSLDAWEKTIGTGVLWTTLGFSIGVAAVSIALSVGLALATVLYGRSLFQRGALSFLIYLPLVFPAIVVAFYTFQLLGKAGFLSRLAYQAGLSDGLTAFPDWVNDPYGIAIVFAHVLMATPFFIILFLNLYSNERLEDFSRVAVSLGATRAQARWRVAIPVLIRKSFATLVLYFIFVMGSYEIPLLLGSQSPQMVSVLAIRKLQRFNLGDIPQAYAISVVYALLVVGLVIWLIGRRREQLG